MSVRVRGHHHAAVAKYRVGGTATYRVGGTAKYRVGGTGRWEPQV
jgi:hypothetical protein